MPDGFAAAALGRREQVRLLQQLLDQRRGIAARRLHDVSPLVAGDLGENPLRNDGARLGLRDVGLGRELVPVLDQEPRRTAPFPRADPDEDPGAVQLPAVQPDALSLSVLATQVFLDTYAIQGIRPAIAREVRHFLSEEAFAEHLARTLEHALATAAWCSADPVCMEIGSQAGQGPDSCNLAACHNCALVPETSCEEFNRFLDRGLVVGTLTTPSLGFFSSMNSA